MTDKNKTDLQDAIDNAVIRTIGMNDSDVVNQRIITQAAQAYADFPDLIEQVKTLDARVQRTMARYKITEKQVIDSAFADVRKTIDKLEGKIKP